MGDFHEQCVCVKFSFKFGKTFLEAFKMLKQVFGDKTMSRTQMHKWHKWFKEGQTSVEENWHSGQPSTSKNGLIHKKILFRTHIPMCSCLTS